MNKFTSVVLSFLLVLGLVFSFPASAYTEAKSLMLNEYQPSVTVSFSPATNGIVFLTNFYKSNSDPSILNEPLEIDTMSFQSGTWQGADVSTLSSSALYDQDVVGFSQSLSYSQKNGFFVYCMVTVIPVIAGDSFSIKFSPTSLVTPAGRSQSYFIPGGTGMKRVFHSMDQSSYTLHSDNQHFVMFFNPDSFYTSRYNASSGIMSSNLVSSHNMSFIREGYGAFFDSFTNNYGSSSGDVLEITPASTVTDFSFSVFEIFDDGTNYGGSLDTDDSEPDSGGSGGILDISGILSGIAQLPSKIGEVIQNLLAGLFMPDTDAIQEEWEFIQSKFAWWSEIQTFVEEIVGAFTSLDGSEPEPITFTLPVLKSDLFKNLSGSVVVIDLSWFADYRDSVHVIISAFIWLAYVWRLFHVLPGIIAGTSGGVGNADSNTNDGKYAEDHYKYLGDYAGRR